MIKFVTLSNRFFDWMEFSLFVLLISLMCIANANAYDGFAHFIHYIWYIIQLNDWFTLMVHWYTLQQWVPTYRYAIYMYHCGILIDFKLKKLLWWEKALYLCISLTALWNTSKINHPCLVFWGVLVLKLLGGHRSPAVACWASDHWVTSSNPLRDKFCH